MVRRKAFTLVELLVVISIIAMLLAILMPALSRARDQARLMTCLANVKQLGLLLGLYQADNSNRVPVMLNVWATNYAPPSGTNLSVALRKYADIKLPSDLNPTKKYWGRSSYIEGFREYYTKYLPTYFVCPLNRIQPEVSANGEWWQDSGKITVLGARLQTYKLKGFMESYVTHLWDKKKGDVIYDFSKSKTDGIREYGVLNWWNASTCRKIKGDYMPGNYYSELGSVAWSKNELDMTDASCLADATAFYCGAGEFIGSAGTSTTTAIFNRGSHKKGGAGGTNALFGDLHANWVKGTRIGDR